MSSESVIIALKKNGANETPPRILLEVTLDKKFVEESDFNLSNISSTTPSYLGGGKIQLPPFFLHFLRKVSATLLTSVPRF